MVKKVLQTKKNLKSKSQSKCKDKPKQQKTKKVTVRKRAQKSKQIQKRKKVLKNTRKVIPHQKQKSDQKIKIQSNKRAKPKAKKALGRKAIIAKPKAVKVLSPEKQEIQRQKEEAKKLKNSKKELIKQQKLLKAQMFELNPNPNIPDINENPFYNTQYLVHQQQIAKKKEGKSDFELKDCCTFCNNREVLQCVKQGDIDKLKKLIKNVEHISNPYQKYSLNCLQNAFFEAIKSKNIEILKVFLDYNDELKGGKINRVKLPSISLEKMGTGQANKFQFYFPIRQIQLSRGGKEGNNAFTHDSKLRICDQVDYKALFKFHPTVGILKILETSMMSEDNDDDGLSFLADNGLKSCLGKIVRSGNYDLLKYIMKKATENHGYGFNKLHTSAVYQGKECDQLKSVLKASLLKKSYDTCCILPGHIAAVNPDITMFKKYFKVFPSIMQQDINHRDLAHYAASNVNSEAIEFLITKKCEINNRDIKGITPLMIACKLGRIQNVNAIIQEQKRQLNSLNPNDEDFETYKTFHQYANTTGPRKKTPLHYAAKYGFLNIIKYLIEEGNADIDPKDTSNNTPLSIASERGHLEVVKYLISKDAVIHGCDKQQKAPIIKATINGHIHIVAYLLKKGVSPNFRDLSENTILHYACAYGWINIVKLLIKGGADPNILNEWKSSSILIAMLKGHFGIVDYLINLDNVNASFQDDQGRTLISQLCMNLNEESAKNLKFLLEKRKINVKLKDVQGLTPLHHLAKCNIQEIASEAVRNKDLHVDEDNLYIIRRGKRIRRRRNIYNNRDNDIIGFFENENDLKEYNKLVKELEDCLMKCAALLLKEGLQVNDITEEGQMTPLFISIMCKNYNLAKWLIEKDSTAISGKIETGGHNILHLLSHDFFQYDYNMLPILIKANKVQLKELSILEDNNGFTPFQSYFNQFEALCSFLNEDEYMQPSEEGKEFIKTKMIPRSINIIIDISKIYAQEFNYDISSYIGMTKFAKDKLEQLKKNQIITDEEYNIIKNLQYDDKYKKLKEKENKMQIIKKEKNGQFKFDDIKKFDPKKQIMGLLQDGLNDTQNKEDSKPKRANKTRKRYYKAARIPQRKALILDNQDPDKDIMLEPIYEKYEININDFYGNVKCKSTPMHIILSHFKKFKEDNQKLFIQLVKTLLNLSSNFIKKQNNENQGFNKFDQKNSCPLFYSILNEQKDIINEFTKSNAINLNIKHPLSQNTIFHLLCNIKNKEIIDNLLQSMNKQDINSLDKNQNSPLHYAAFKRNEYYIEQLIQYGVKINQTNKYGMNALHLSTFAFDNTQDHTPKIERLLINAGININQVDKEGRTPIFYVFYKHKAVEQIDPASITMTLVQQGNAKLNIQDIYSNTPLLYACQASATISALTLINNGADTKIKSVLGNSPFTETMNQVICKELAIFMIQNGCNINEQVIQANDKVQQTDKIIKNIDKLIIPMSLNKLMKKQNKEYKDYKDYLEQNYKLEEKSPFYLALSDPEGSGISYLLISKQYDIFQALISCLALKKYEMFLDLLENQKNNSKIINKVDNKKRNILFILLNNLAKGENEDKDNKDEDEDEDEENNDNEENNDENVLNRGIEICKILQNNYKQDISQTDYKGRNILHKIARQRNPELFLKIYDILTPQQQKQMINQKDTYKEATPLVYLLSLKLVYGVKDKSNDFKRFNIKQIDLTYIKKVKPVLKNNVEIPSYLQNKSQYPVILYEKDCKTTLLHFLISKIAVQKEGYTKANIDKITAFGFDLNEVEPGTGRSILTLAVLLNLNHIIKPLLGFQYNPKTKKEEIKGKPLLDINSQDLQGKTALHYAIKPTEVGIWMNSETLESLLQVKANPLIKDINGLNALDYAIDCPSSYEIILKYFPKANPNKSKVKAIQKKDQQINNQIAINGVFNRNYYQDAEFYFQDLLQKKQQEKMQIDDQEKLKKMNEVKVDFVAKFDKVCEVVKDIEGTGFSFDTLMVKIDAKKYYYGECNFYVIQLLFDKVKNIYILWTRWGRIGSEGQYQRTPYNYKDEAVKEFKKVFRQKTGQKWEEIEQYNHVPKKYKVKRIGGKLIYEEKNGQHWKYSERSVDIKDFILDFSQQKLLKSNLTENELSFTEALVNQASLIRKGSSFQQRLYKDTFLSGLLDKSVVENLKVTLDKIEQLIIKREQFSKKRDFEAFSYVENQLFDLSNEYYEAVCPMDFAYSRMVHIYSQDALNKQRDVVNLIYDFEHITKLMFGAAFRIKEMNPYDYCFKSLHSKLQQLDESNDEFTLLMTYINQTLKEQGYHQSNPNALLKAVFKIQQDPKHLQTIKSKVQFEKSEETFNNLHNHFLLFHGTSNANVLSIIEQGLVITPKNSSRFAGSAFGEGIYFADSFNLACQYSDNRFNTQYDLNDDFFVLACEVALGNVCNSIQYDSFTPSREYNSLRMMSNRGPNFDQNLMREDGCIWPIGQSIAYESPVLKKKDKTFETYRDFKKASQGIIKGKNSKSQKKNKKQIDESQENSEKEDSDQQEKSENEDNDSESEQMQIDTSSKRKQIKKTIRKAVPKKKDMEDDEDQESDNEESKSEEDEEEDNVKEYKETIGTNVKKYKIEPHVISYLKFGTNYNRNTSFFYPGTDAQYVVFNPDQVRVRYILQFSKKPEKDNDNDSNQNDNSEDDD